MSFWKQIPGTTKVYLIILIYLLIMLFGLILTRLVSSSMEGLSLNNLLNRKGAQATATAASETSLAASAIIVPTFAPGTPWLKAIEIVEVRNGPGEQYEVIALMESGQYAEIVSISPDRGWWMIMVPYIESGRGWVPSGNVIAENVDNISALIEEGTPTILASQEDIPIVRAFMNVNIRSGPDISFERIGLLRNSETAEVVGVSQDGFWWIIKLPGEENVQGWVAKDYVIPANTENVPVVRLSGVTQDRIPPTPAPGAPSLTAMYPVNIRAGPGIEYAVVGQLGQGQIAEVVGIDRDGLWVAIKLPSQQNGRGWVAAAYVKLANAGSVPILK